MDTENKSSQFHPEQFGIQDMNRLAEGMMFGDKFIVYNDSTPLFKLGQNIKVDYYSLVYITKGKFSYMINGTRIMVNTGQFVMYNVGDFVSDLMFSPDCSGWVFCWSAALMLDSSDTGISELLSSIVAYPTAITPNEGVGEMIGYYGHILETKHANGITDVRLTFLSLLNDVLKNTDAVHLRKVPAHRSAKEVHRRFTRLLLETYPRPREVKWYADAISVSPKYLTTLVRKLSGKNATDCINETVMSDVRRLLIHTEKTAKEIAGELGFDNPAFFGKYVKKHSGLTPLQLRDRLRTESD